MKIPRRQFLRLTAGAAALPAFSRMVSAQTYPTRPITIMVGAPAGGPTDTIARILTQHMRASLGQAIIIENNGTAGGTIAHGRTARAAPDGYTLSLGHTATHVLNGAVYSLTYDVSKDLNRFPWFPVIHGYSQQRARFRHAICKSSSGGSKSIRARHCKDLAAMARPTMWRAFCSNQNWESAGSSCPIAGRRR